MLEPGAVKQRQFERGLARCVECTSTLHGFAMRTGDAIHGDFLGATGDWAGEGIVQGKPLFRRAPLSGRGTNTQNRVLETSISRRYRGSRAHLSDSLGNAFPVHG